MEKPRNYFEKYILYGLLLMGILSLLLLPAGTVQAFSSQCGQWSIVHSPNPGISPDVLKAVTSVSAKNVWAVGSTGTTTLIEHWNGTKWKVVQSPTPPGTTPGHNAVAAISANDIWAVGAQLINQSAAALTEHWDGSSWTVIRTPKAAGYYLTGVAGSAADDVWSVGEIEGGGSQQSPVLEHWNGTIWSLVKSPNPPSSLSALSAITVLSAHDVWAVGSSLYPNGVQQTLAEHWNGTAWSIVPSPNPAGLPISELDGIAASSSNDVWAVGFALHTDGSNRQTLIEHWNGSSWSIILSPQPPAAQFSLFSGVVSIAANDAWAVGAYDQSTGPYLTLTEHWDGSSWRVISSPNPPTIYDTFLTGVTAASASNVWTVGSSTTNNDVGQTLVEFYC